MNFGRRGTAVRERQGSKGRLGMLPAAWYLDIRAWLQPEVRVGTHALPNHDLSAHAALGEGQ